jgi:hypothetical protein
VAAGDDEPAKRYEQIRRNMKAKMTKEEPAVKAPRAPRPPVNRYKALMKNNDTAVAKKYSPKGKYETGDVLEHASFGRGVTTAVRGGTKIEVMFESGSKVLIQGLS